MRLHPQKVQNKKARNRPRFLEGVHLVQARTASH